MPKQPTGAKTCGALAAQLRYVYDYRQEAYAAAKAGAREVRRRYSREATTMALLTVLDTLD